MFKDKIIPSLISFLIVLSILAITIESRQARQTISFGSIQEILNTTSTGAVNGATFALPTGAANVTTFQTIYTGSPSAVTVTFQASLDGTNWISLNSTTATDGFIFPSGINSYRFVRATQTSRTGGTLTQVLASVNRTVINASGVGAAVGGDLYFAQDNVYDIGNAGSVGRPNDINAGGHIRAGTNGIFNWSGRSYMSSNADGNITLFNNAGSDFSRLNFGGVGAGFPALKRNGVNLNVRLADDSADTAITASYFAAGGSSYGTFSFNLAAVTFAGMGTPANGTMRYCSDCTAASNPCTSGGTGAFAKRLNGAWDCR